MIGRLKGDKSVNRKQYFSLFVIWLILILNGCMPGSPDISPTVGPTTPARFESTVTESPTRTPETPSETQITIDGEPSDWATRPLLQSDPAGDSDTGILDLTGIYAFINHDALYLMVKMGDPKAEFKDIEIIIQAGNRQFLVSWDGERNVHLADITEGFTQLGYASYSKFVLGSVFEARIDLRDIGQVENLSIQAFNVMAGECCQPPAWHAADNFGGPLSPPVINEVDPPELLKRIPSYALADWMGLPAGWQVENIFAPPLPDVNQLAVSQSGVIYAIQSNFTLAISTIDPETGAIRRVLDFPWELWGPNSIAGGPGDTVFTVVRNEIWQIKPDGSHEVWGKVVFGEGTHPTFFTKSGQLIGFKYSNPTCVIELLPDATTRDIACGFQVIWDVIADDQGTLFVADWSTGQVVRVAPDGSRQVLAHEAIFRDTIDVGFNTAGKLFLSVFDNPFQHWDPNINAFAPLSWDLTKCAYHAADFVFSGNSRVLFMDPTWGMVTWADLDTNSSGVLVPNNGVNTQAAAIGPDGAFYFATTGCRGKPPAQIMRLVPGSAPTVFISDLPDTVYDLAFAPDGGMYLDTWKDGLANTPLYYVAPGSQQAQLIPDSQNLTVRDIAVLPNGDMLGWVYRTNRLVEFSPQGYVKDIPFNPPEPIESFSIDYAPDGYLYGFAELARGNRQGPMIYRQLLRIDLKTGETRAIYQNDSRKDLAGGTLSAAPDGSLWLVLFPDFEIYRVLPDGTATRFATNLPTDSWTVKVDNRGDVYFTSPSGIYRIYHTP
jgi:hypothetical protein